MNQHKRMKRQSLKACLVNRHKWTATFCKYTDLAKSTIVEVQNVNGAGRVRVPQGWFVSFFMTDKALAKAERQARVAKRQSRLNRLNPDLQFVAWDVERTAWIREEVS